MTHAVFSLHVPASLYEGAGFRVVPDGPVIPAEPLKTFSTMEEAEQWRADRLGRGK